MRTTQRVFANGKVTIPLTIREAMDITDGDVVEIEVTPVREVEK